MTKASYKKIPTSLFVIVVFFVVKPFPSPRSIASIIASRLPLNIMQVLAYAFPIAGPFTVLWLNRPAVYGGSVGNGIKYHSPVHRASRSRGFSRFLSEKPHKWGLEHVLWYFHDPP
jgi:hypothetical protein